jgi:chromosomal replication initiation ATPase DnaA
MAQLPLDLPLEPRFGEEDFLVSRSNADAYAMLESWPDWPGGMLALAGPPGSGKSHLAAIWSGRAGARQISGRALGRADIPALAASGAVAVEDADRPGLEEAALFHLINLAGERGASLLITGATDPSRWPIATPDLASRLRRMPAVAIAAPDDALIRALFVKLFVDRQIIVDTTLVEHLALRVERSFDAIRAAVDKLDKEALARGRRLTRALAAKVLALDEE